MPIICIILEQRNQNNNINQNNQTHKNTFKSYGHVILLLLESGPSLFPPEEESLLAPWLDLD